jgi:hypothetical protein
MGKDGQPVSPVGDRAGHAEKDHDWHGDYRATPCHNIDKATSQPCQNQYNDFPCRKFHD